MSCMLMLSGKVFLFLRYFCEVYIQESGTPSLTRIRNLSNCLQLLIFRKVNLKYTKIELF